MNILIIDDDATLLDLLIRELTRSGNHVIGAATAADGIAAIERTEPDVVLLDLLLPDTPGIDLVKQLRHDRPSLELVVLTAHGTVDTALTAMKLGAFDYLQKPCYLQELELTLGRAFERRRLGEENARLRDGLSAGTGESGLLGSGQYFDELTRFIAKVAASDSSVLIRGETGTGKEIVARTIHLKSKRRDAPFVVVDCATLNENLLQSELFGHEKGAFTGALKKKYGLFEVADSGTVFLDEIGDVSSTVQASLLRVLESSTFRRLGDTREITVDVRLLAATNRDIERMIREERFRQDLFFRLNAIHVDLLPLRRRKADIPNFIEEFVARYNKRNGTDRSFSAKAIETMCQYHWPGNIRELRHVVECALVLAEDKVVEPADLPHELAQVKSVPISDLPNTLSLATIERQYIVHVLAECGNHRASAAKVLGIGERTLYRKLKEYQLVEDDDLDSPNVS